MIAQSVAGLAALAVNDGRGDELVWVETGNEVIEKWLIAWQEAHPKVVVRDVDRLWDLVTTYAEVGIIKGYILYKSDASKGNPNDHRPGMDCSVNVATSLAGLFDAIIVDETLEAESKAHGLKLLIDVRNKTQAWCFEKYRSRFSRHIVCMQDPVKCHARDLAIAHQAFTMYGHEASAAAVMQWLEPVSSVIGWNGGDEFQTTDLSSRWGHIQTSTDWCVNLPVLMAGSEQINRSRSPAFDPQSIDWNDRRSAVTFVSSDGDNVQWLVGGFFNSSQMASYWGNSDRGKIPFGWSCCFAHLAQLCPQSIDFATATRSKNDSFIEWGGGYYYPDRFARDRPDRWSVLARHAQHTWSAMEQNNTYIIGFNVAQYNSADARQAYDVLARQTDRLLAILVFQYSPYEAGAGETFWVKDRNGIDLPVISARYAIWEHSNDRNNAGTPAKVAHDIARTVDRTAKEKLPKYDWAIAHVWSYFKRSTGDDEDSENLLQQNAPEHGGVRGYSPVLWCAERLPKGIRVIGPDEMAWRIRMNHSPSQTTTFLSHFLQGILSTRKPMGPPTGG